MTLQELYQQYFDFKEKIWQNSTCRTALVVKRRIDECPECLDNFREIRDYLINNYPRDAAKRTLKAISAANDWAIREGILDENRFKPLIGDFRRKRRKRRKINPFSLPEKRIVMNGFVGNHYWDLINFLFKTGCRPSEAYGLCWSDINLDLLEIFFHSPIVEGVRQDELKTEEFRKFPINSALKDFLLQLKKKASSETVFTSPDGCQINHSNFSRRAWKPVMKNLPIKYRRPYGMRQFFITQCLYKLIPVPVIAEWVGNSPAVIFEHYAGFLPDYEVPDF